MIPAAFAYHRPNELAEAIDLLRQFGDDAKLVAGGMSLIPTMKARLSQPQHLIDLAAIAPLKGVAVTEGQLRIGATTTHWEVESSPVVRSALPMLSEAAGVIADPQVRNRGTMGGSLANSDPAADYPASAQALGAELVCIGPDGERIINVADWFQGLFTTDLGEGEILREIRFPLLPPRTAGTYLKLPHPASRFAVVGVSVAITIDAAGRCENARIGVTGVGTHSARARGVEAALRGKDLIAPVIDAASHDAPDGLEISGDLHFSAEDKMQLCRVYVRRAVTEAAARARAGNFQGPQS